MVHLEKINGIPDDFKNKLSFKELQAVDTAKTFHILVDENGKS